MGESALVRDLPGAEAALAPLRDAGIRITLGDFGTGYSSLYHLRNFKVDKIKIDRTFVAKMTEAGENAAIVRALLGLGHGLGVKVTAEGVDSADQRDALIEEGCDEAQGILFSRALTGEETEELFHTAAQRESVVG